MSIHGEDNLPRYRYVSSSRLDGTWKDAKNSWGHSLHRMCSRTGSFPPSLARYFVERFSQPGGRVLDPFSGKGTTPLEACISGRIGIGNDVSPEAYILTHAKVKPLSLPRLNEYLNALRNRMDSEDAASDDIDDNVSLFYNQATLKQIVALRKVLKHESSDEAIFVKALMCGIIHGASKVSLSLPCSHSFSMSPAYVRRYAREHNLKKPKRDVINCLRMKAADVLVDDLPTVRGEALQSDAAAIPLDNESIDLVVTSPPYFNKQTYPWDNWLRLWFLGFDYKEVRKTLFQSGSKEKFIHFMTVNLGEMFRVLKWDSACFVVVGDVSLGDGPINTAKLLAKPAESIGFKVHRIVNDQIAKTEKYFMFVPSDKGVRKDRVVELHKGEPREQCVRLPWEAAAT